MLKLNWHKQGRIQTLEDIDNLIFDANKCSPNISGFDTETTGLHLIDDKPFLMQFGFVNLKTKEAYVYFVDREHDKEIFDKVVPIMWLIASKTNLLIGANIKYDLHMMTNIGHEYPYDNVSEMQVMIRLVHDAIPTKRGGVPLALKNYASQYIEKGARFHEKLLEEERGKIASDYKNQLKIELRQAGFTWKSVEKTIEDSVLEPEDYPEQVRVIYEKWYNNLPERIKRNMTSSVVSRDDIPYNMLNRKVMYSYAEYDVIYTLEVAASLIPALKIKKQWVTFERENSLIKHLYRMERMGFEMNVPYILESKQVLKQYLLKQRQELISIAKRPVTASQQKVIKEVFLEVFGIKVDATGKDELNDLYLELSQKDKKEPMRFVSIIQELRTLEKWYVTYLKRFLREAEYSDTIYSLMSQATPVTGRLSSDFQQFPKGAIEDENGKELFRPRNMVKTHAGYLGTAYIDYSQIELRFQAFYTILIGHPDLNLCRAYMPYKCYKLDFMNNRIAFNHENPNDIITYKDYTWYHEEDNKEWHPVDVHGATTQQAFPEIEPGTPEFAHWRGKVGKTTNFAKNYGATRKVIARTFAKFNFSEEKITQIDASYYKAFPGVKEYQQYCYQIALNGFMTNMFGRRYYGISGHNGMNALVQGSAADFLKEAIIKLGEYIFEKGLKSRMVINIHDEIAFAIAEGEELEIWNFQAIMQEFPETQVPIVADLEFTATLWGEKEEVEDVKDIIRISKLASTSTSIETFD